MKKLIYVMMLMILSFNILAKDIDVNTTITLDWIGNDEFYIRTESKDVRFNCTNQTDTKFNISIEYEFDDCNKTDTQLLLEPIKNMTDACHFLKENTNCTNELVNRVEAHTRLTTYWEDCKSERDYFESDKDNITKQFEECDSLKQTCEQTKSAFEKDNTKCKEELEAIKDENKSKNMWIVLAIVGGWLANSIYNDQIKKRIPGTMKDMGYDGQVTQDKKKW